MGHVRVHGTGFIIQESWRGFKIQFQGLGMDDDSEQMVAAEPMVSLTEKPAREE